MRTGPLECGHPEECIGSDGDCFWCDDLDVLKQSCSAMEARNAKLLDALKEKSVQLVPGEYSLRDTGPIGLMLIEKGAVVTLDTDEACVAWVDVNDGTLNIGRDHGPPTAEDTITGKEETRR